MSELYFIGGSTLSGKAEVATMFKRIVPEVGGIALQYIGTDTLRSVLWAQPGIDEQEPALVRLHSDRRLRPKVADRIAYLQANPHAAVERLQEESEVVWRRGLIHAIRGNLDRGLSTLFEGVAARPELLTTLEKPHRAVFVGNNTPTDKHLAGVIENVRRTPGHWMYKWSDDQIAVYAYHQVSAYSDQIRDDAERYKYPYFDLSQGNDHTIIQQQAAEHLATMKIIQPTITV